MSDSRPAMRSLKRLDRWVALLLCLVATLALQLGSRSQGFTRDEGYYFQAAENHVGYLEESLAGITHGRPLTFADPRVIDRWLSYNSEHPPLMKTLFGVSWRLLHRCSCDREAGLHPLHYATRHRTLGLLHQGDAMRLPTQILSGAMVAGVYLFGALCLSRLAGLVAAGLTLLQPRLFFHSQLSCFDAPVTAMIFLTTLCYLWAISASDHRSRWRRALVFAGVLSAAMLTKHNTFFLPPILFLHWLWAHRSRGQTAGRHAPGTRRRALAVLLPPWALCAATLTPLLYFAGWPHLWHAPVPRFLAYVGFHLRHVHYNIEYLGVNYNRPPYPWHYVPVMTLYTVPVTTLGLALLGVFFVRKVVAQRAAGSASQGDAAADAASATQGNPGVADLAPVALIVLSVLWPMAVIMRPGTPIFGAEKHWLPAVPFLALLAGAGLQALLDLVDRTQLLRASAARRLAPALAGVVLVPAALDVVQSHPYALSHYNALAGGPQGGADLGLNRHFWGYAVRGLFPTFNREVRPNASVYFHDANWLMLQMSMKDGLLRRDIYDSGMEEAGVRAADLGLVLHERHFNKYEYWLWDAFASTRPLAVVTHQGVPVATLYTRPGAAASASSAREFSSCPIR